MLGKIPMSTLTPRQRWLSSKSPRRILKPQTQEVVTGEKTEAKLLKINRGNKLEEGRNKSFTIESLRNTNLDNLYYLVWVTSAI